MLVRNILGAMARTPYIVCLAGRGSSEAMKNMVMRLKLFSIVSVPFSLVDLRNLTMKVAQSLSVSDSEGAAMSSLSFAIVAADTVDSASTFINSTLTLTGHATIEALSKMALPLGIAISVSGTCSRLYQLAKTSRVYQSILSTNFTCFAPKESANRIKDIELALGLTEIVSLIEELKSGPLTKSAQKRIEKLQDKKRSIILRTLPSEAHKDLEVAFSLLKVNRKHDLSNHELCTVCQLLKNIEKHLEKKLLVSA